MRPKHTGKAYLFTLARMFERASYYGFRAILVLYLISDSVKMEPAEALSIYAYFTALIYVAAPIGGLLGDLVLGNKLAILIGGLIEICGIMVFCIPTLDAIYLGMGLIILGNGLFSPNFLAQFGKLYHGKDRIADAGFTFLNIGINVGAFFGILLVGLLYDYSLVAGLGLAALFMLIALLVTYFIPEENLVNENQWIQTNNNDQVLDEIEEVRTTKANISQSVNQFSIGTRALLVSAAVIMYLLFWMVYDLIYSLLEEVVSGPEDFAVLPSWHINYASLFLLGLALLLAWVWTRFDHPRFAKIGVGMFAMGIAFLMVFFKTDAGDNYTSWFVVFSSFLTIGEIFISPAFYALMPNVFNPKYLGIVYGIMALLIVASMKFATFLTGKYYGFIAYYASSILIVFAGLFLVCGIVTFILSLTLRKR